MTPRPNAEAMWESYMRRTGGDVMYQREASYRYQADVLRDLLRRLEVILEDEGVDEEKRERILLSVLYGAPSPADAEQRIRDREERARLLANVPEPRLLEHLYPWGRSS